jgi:hypothetical protein
MTREEDLEAQGWREAALYTEEAEARDDFMTGWRTAHRVREAAQRRDDVEYAALCEQVEQLASVIQSAYNALHMETRERAVAILHSALSGRREIPEMDWEWGIRDKYSCGAADVRMWGSQRDRIESQMYRWPGSTLVKRVAAGRWVTVRGGLYEG